MDSNTQNITCVIEPRHELEIARVRQYAENPKNFFDHTKALFDGAALPGDSPKHVVKFRTQYPNIAWRVVYSVDVIDGETLKRLAVSIRGAPERAPNEGVMIFIAKQFGLQPPFEYLGPSKWGFHFERAIHVLARIGGETNEPKPETTTH